MTDTDLISPINEIKEVKETKSETKPIVKKIYISPPKETIFNENFKNICSYLNMKSKLEFSFVSKKYRSKLLSSIYEDLNNQLTNNNKVIESIHDVSIYNLIIIEILK